LSSGEDPAAELLASLSNAALKLDPLTEPRLRDLEGRSARIEVLTPAGARPLLLRLEIRRASLQFSLADQAPADALIRGSLPELLAYFQGRSGAGRSGPGRSAVVQEGDEALLAALAGVLRNFEPDLAEPLRGVLGPETANALVGFAEAALATTRSALEALGSAAEAEARRRFASEGDFETARRRLEALSLELDRVRARTDAVSAARAAGPRPADVP
jgi:ubiquinone biosynthesis protein UbiJ